MQLDAVKSCRLCPGCRIGKLLRQHMGQRPDVFVLQVIDSLTVTESKVREFTRRQTLLEHVIRLFDEAGAHCILCRFEPAQIAQSVRQPFSMVFTDT